MTFATAGAYADDIVVGDDPPPPPARRRRRGRRPAAAVLATCVALGLHASLLLLWRATRPPSAPDLVGQGGGSGGVSLTLVRGSAGGAFASAAPSDSVDPQQQISLASGDRALAPLESTRSSVDDASAATTGVGHGSGDVGDAADGGSRASSGSGYDRGAFASLAPLSFARASDPGLAEQVRRCLRDEASTSVTLSVIVDDQGVFVDAFRQVEGLATQPSVGETRATAAGIDALRRCSPYHGLAAGLGRPLTLVLPAASGG